MSSRSTLTAPPSQQPTTDQLWTLALASVGSFLVILDLFAVTTALPTLRVALHASITTLDWTINAYTLAFAVLLMTAAALGDRWARRRVYASGLLLFAAASVACALAPNGAVLVGARAVQGIGAAVTMPTALALINAAFPTERRGWAQGVFGAVTGLATVLGPVFGGGITQMLSWSYIFWVNVPIGVAAAVAVLLRIRDVQGGGPGGRRAPDLLGLVLGGASVLALVWGVVRAAADGWGDRAVVGSLVLGGAALAALFAWQRRASRPLIPLRLFTDTAFASGIAGIFLQSASLTALVFFTAQFFQNSQGDGPLVAGLRLLPLGLVPLALGPWSGTATDRVGAGPMIVAGMTLQTAGTTIPAVFSRPGLWYPILAVAMAVVAVGFTFAVPALTKSVVGSVEPADIGTASGLFSTVRQVGAAFGVAAASAAFTATGGYPTASAVASGYRGAMIVAAVLAGLGTATTAMSRRAARGASSVPRG
ncbi:MAG TPA: MFS transporter [Spirillospora sp.]|nr:MFS transporter [Spirillospora sp.]